MIRRVIEAGIGANGKCFTGRYELEPPAWRGAMAQYLRVKERSNTTRLASFGPSIVDCEGALEERFIRRPQDFVHALTGFSANTDEVEMLGQAVRGVAGLMRVGERADDSATWLGNIAFTGPEDAPSVVAKLEMHRGNAVHLFLPDASGIETTAPDRPLQSVLAGMRLIRPAPKP